MARIQGITIKLQGDTTALQASLNEVYKKSADLNKELRQINTSLKFHPGNTDLLAQKQRVLKDAVEASRKKIDELKEAQRLAAAELAKGNYDQGEYDRLTREILKAEDQLKGFEGELASMNSKFTTAGKSIEAAGGKISNAGEKIGKVGKTLSTRVTAPIVAAGVAVGKAAIDFESAFAGVRKTVDATEEEFAMLEEGIRQMAKELPTSAVEIAGVAEAAGQLGIEVPNILGFTRVMIDLGESTNMSAEEAATALARLANITGMSQTDFDRLGSVVVDLGNNFATTEKEIVDLGLRLAGAGAQIGMTEAETMSFAAALSSVGIEAQAGGSAFSKVMIEMQLAAETGYSALNNIEAILADAGVSFVEFEQAAMHGGDALKDVAHRTGISEDALKTMHKELLEGIGSVERFADVMGVAGDEFVEMFKSDPAGALMTFVEGLASAEDRGVSAIAVLDEMGITEVRLRDTLLRAAGASDLFSDAIATGTKAWEENTALTNEAEQRYETMASKLGILKNNFIDVGISLGEQLLPYVEKFVNWLGNVADKLSEVNPKTMDTAIKIAALAAAIGPLMMILGPLLKIIGGVVTGIGIFSQALGVLTAGAVAASPVVAGVAKVIAFLMNPIVAVGLALATLAFIFYQNWDHIKEYTIAAWEAISAFLTSAWTAFIEGAGAIWESLKTTFSNLWAGISEGASAAWEGITSFLTGLWDSFIATVQPIWDTLVNVFTVVWMVIAEVFRAGWMIIESFLTVAWQLLANTATAIFQALTTVFEAVWGTIKSVTETVWNAISGFLSPIWEGIRSTATTIFNAIKSAIETAWNAINSVTSSIWNAISGFLSPIWNSIKNTATSVFNAIKSTIESIWNSVRSVTSSVWNSISSTVSSIWNNIKNTATSVFNAIKSAITNIWNGIRDTSSSVWNGIKSTLTSIFDSIKSSVTSIFNSIKSTITGVWDSIKSATTNAWNAVKNAIEGPINRARDAVSNAISRIKSILNIQLPFPKIKLPHFSISGRFSLNPPQIPKFGVQWYDKGGIFRGPTVIGVGEKRPEFVGALDDLKAIVAEVIDKRGSGGDGGIVITGNTFAVREEADIRKIAEELMTLADRKKRGGR